jgi:Tfp pilus assembly protein PilO
MRSKLDRHKEKNRLAQQRFRARQKATLEELKTQHVHLEEVVRQQTAQLTALQRENALLRDLLQEHQGGRSFAQGAALACA